jgi:hypothetical protein
MNTPRTILPGLALLLLFICGTPGINGEEAPAGDNSVDQKADAGTSLPTVNPGAMGKRVCLSLKVLAAKAKTDPRAETVKTLGGIGWLEGYVVDEEKKDIVLIGRSAKERPSLFLDDLTVNIRNIWNRSAYPCISLDPRPEDIKKLNALFAKAGGGADFEQQKAVMMQIKKIWGPQLVMISGIPSGSRYAHVMIDADYNMKKLSQGLYAIEGIDSALNIAIGEIKTAIATDTPVPFSGTAISRLWFHVNDREPTFTLNGNMVLIDNCSIRLLTEKGRATADGVVSYSRTDEPYALEFAKLFSANFHYIAGQDPIYADLENLFRLNALLRAVNFRRDDEKAGLDLAFFLKEYKFQSETMMPQSLPGLVNYKEVTARIEKEGETYEFLLAQVIFGGVSMDSVIDKAQFVNSDTREMEELRQAVAKARPDESTLFWELP